LLRFESWILDSTSGQLVFNGLSKLKSDYWSFKTGNQNC
jgi:hypothetical protein